MGLVEKKILAILYPDVAMGFKMAGVDIWRAEDVKSAENLVLKALNEDSYGIVILEEELYEGFNQKLKDMVMDSVIPLIVPIPIKRLSGERVEDYLRNLIRRSIGFYIRIRR